MSESKHPQLGKSAQEVFVNTPLYKSFSLEGFEDDELSDLFFGSHTVDAYCKTCERPTVFRFKNEKADYNDSPKKLKLVGTVLREAECTRSSGGVLGVCGEKFVAVFFKHHDEIKKIGQMPSAADMAFAMLDSNIRKQLNKGHSQELGRAIGLRAHGVGVGAFVYLRRIFESLISAAEKNASEDSSWDHETYEKSRVAERVGLLKGHLPKRLVENSALYAVLSKGIHELTEEECLAHFSLLYTSIVAILKERAEEEEFKKAVKDVNTLASDLSARGEVIKKDT